MSVRIHLHKSHRNLVNGREAVEVEGQTVESCLAALIREYPGLEGHLFEDSRQLKKNVEIYVNLESAFPDELAKPVRDGDEIHITLILSGG